jgi:hypothetical protein
MRQYIIKNRPRLGIWVVKHAGKVVLRGTESECQAFVAAQGDVKVKIAEPGTTTPRTPKVPAEGRVAVTAIQREAAERNGITILQQQAVDVLAQQGTDCCGCDTKTSLKGDNMTWFDAIDLIRELKINQQTAAGLIGSMMEADLVADAEAGSKARQRGKDTPANLYLTDRGIDCATTLKDE